MINFEHLLNGSGDKHPDRDTAVPVEVVVLYADLRDFSNWCNNSTPQSIHGLVEDQLYTAYEIMKDNGWASMKWLGDGFLFVWAAMKDRNMEDCVLMAIDTAFEIHKKYIYYFAETANTVPEGYGIGISAGEAYRVTPRTAIEELNTLDYVGYPLNSGARLQRLARANATVIDFNCAQSLNRQWPPTLKYYGTTVIEPPNEDIDEARKMKGLRREDQESFKYIVFQGLVSLDRTLNSKRGERYARPGET